MSMLTGLQTATLTASRAAVALKNKKGQTAKDLAESRSAQEVADFLDDMPSRSSNQTRALLSNIFKSLRQATPSINLQVLPC